MGQPKNYLTVIFLFVMGMTTSLWAQSSDIEIADAPANLAQELPSDLGSHIKDVFIKGSSDGHSVFTVLGISKGAKLSKNILKRMVHLQELKDIGDRFNNAEHTNDFKDEWQSGVEASKEALPEILKAPWRSVKKIPYSHKVTIQQARDAYQSADNTAQGLVKYTGIAAWAYTKDAYYLVIETPYQLIKNAAEGFLSVPFRMTMQVLEIGIRFTWFAVKATSALIASGVVMAYSVVSSTVGAVISFVIDAPTFIWRPLQMGEDLNVKPEKLVELGILLQQILATNVATDKEIFIEAETSSTKEKFKFYVLNEKKEKELAYVAKLSIENETIFLDFDMARRYFEDLKQDLADQGMEKHDRKDKIKLDMRKIIDLLKSKIAEDMIKLPELEGGTIFKCLQINEEFKLAADKLELASKVLEQVLQTKLGEKREVQVESKLQDNKDHFKVYIGKSDSQFAYEVTLKAQNKMITLNMEMVRGYYKLLKRKFRIQGIAEGSLEEHVSLELRELVSQFKIELAKALAI